MARHFHLTSSAASVVLELTQDQHHFADLLRLLYDRRFTGQILVDFHRGHPRKVGFPQVARVTVRQASASDPAPKS